MSLLILWLKQRTVERGGPRQADMLRQSKCFVSVDKAIVLAKRTLFLDSMTTTRFFIENEDAAPR